MESIANKRRICLPAPASALRLEIEHALERSFPAALTPAHRTIHETAATGIAEVDALLEGGLPVGAISEINGPESSGRTTLCPVVSCPENRGGPGMRMGRRRRRLRSRIRRGQRRQSAPTALGALPQVRHRPSVNEPATKPFAQLDQALRATDLLLQAGGFAAIVLDLGDTAAEHARRIPLATWFRFRQAADAHAPAWLWWLRDWLRPVQRRRGSRMRGVTSHHCRRNGTARLSL